MNVQLKGNEQLTELLNEWYLQIRSRNSDNANRLKTRSKVKLVIYKTIKIYYFITRSLISVINI